MCKKGKLNSDKKMRCKFRFSFLLLYSFVDGRPLGLPDGTYFFAVPDPAGLPLGLPVGT